MYGSSSPETEEDRRATASAFDADAADDVYTVIVSHADTANAFTEKNAMEINTVEDCRH